MNLERRELDQEWASPRGEMLAQQALALGSVPNTIIVSKKEKKKREGL